MSLGRDDRLDRDVDLLADAADSEAIDAEDRREPPSFGAVLARAHRIDPTAVNGADLDRANALPVRAATPDPDRVLETLVTAARAEAEHSAADRRSRTAPSLRRPARRKAAVVVGALATTSAVAAAVVLAMSLRGDAIDREADRDSGSLAAARAQRDDAGGVAVPSEAEAQTSPRARRGKSEAARRPAWDVDVEPEVEVEVEPEPEPEPEPEVEAEPEPESRPASGRTGNTRSALERLDDRARRALAAGNMRRADDLLAELIGRGGRHRLVEAAFGDRFAIAHRLHSASEQRALWRAYLGRFPNGRFADDARAGLCRRAPKDATACWSAYLDDFPRGAYRAQAERAQDEGGS